MRSIAPDPETAKRFRAAIEPLRVALLDLVTQTRALREEHGAMPTEGSLAMQEVSKEATFAGTWGQCPAANAHSLSLLLLMPAEDMIQSLCRLLELDDATVFGHIVLARAIVESCARSAYLADTQVDLRRRVARAQNDRLFSLAEQDKLPGAARDVARRREILDEAARQGFAKRGGRKHAVVSLEEFRPGNTDVVKWLFDTDPDTGELVYRYWCAHAHSTMYGIVSQLQTLGPRDPMTALTPAVLVVTSESTAGTLAAVLLAYVLTGIMHRGLFGWQSEAWERTVVNAARLIRQTLPNSE